MKLAIFAGSALAAPLLLAAPAMAQTHVYVNGGYTQLQSDEADLGGFTGRLGLHLNPFFAIEGEGTLGVHKDHQVKLKHETGIFAVASLPVAEHLDLFARLGASQIRTNPKLGDDSGFAYGVGGQYMFTGNDGVRGDVTRHEDHDQTSYSLSYVRMF
jgi:outer membrane immunogenic protein